MTPADDNSILALNPLATPGTTPDPVRYIQVSDSPQIDGPDNDGDDILGRGLEVSHEEVEGSTATVVAGWTHPEPTAGRSAVEERGQHAAM